MKTVLWLPTLLLEFVKSRTMPYVPSSKFTREMEEAARNNLRLVAYKAKRTLRK